MIVKYIQNNLASQGKNIKQKSNFRKYFIFLAPVYIVTLKKYRGIGRIAIFIIVFFILPFSFSLITNVVYKTLFRVSLDSVKVDQ